MELEMRSLPTANSWTSLGKDHDIEPPAALHELAVAIKNGTYAAH
jgi:hypothetical protein